MQTHLLQLVAVVNALCSSTLQLKRMSLKKADMKFNSKTKVVITVCLKYINMCDKLHNEVND